jgi:acetyl-CoA C-acetyltransferase
MGNGEIIDSMIHDGLWCAFEMEHMGQATQRCADEHEIAREAQDAVAAASHERAADAIKHGRLADEIVEVTIPQRRGDPLVVDTDEGVRPGTTTESLAGLKQAFVPDGTITAGNA